MSNAIVLDNVSKRFRLYHSRPTTLQEKFVSLLQPSKSSEQQQEPEDFWALQEISIEIEQGQTVGLIGPNGSGKSTALKLMARILEPTSGSIRVNGRVSALLELGAGFHPDLTGRENIFLNGALLGLNRDDIERHFDEIVEFSELESFIDMPVKHYSSGMYMRLGFSVAVHLDPDILLIDEVLAVGDASFQNKCFERLSDLRRSDVTVVLVSHDLGTVQSMCDKAYWFSHGNMVESGQPTDVIMSYLSRVAKDDEQRSKDSRRSSPDEDDNEHRWGSGKVRIDKVELCGAGGESKAVFHTDEPLGIRMHYVADEPVDNPIFGIAIHHKNGTHVSGPNTRFNDTQISEVHGKGVVEYKIPSLPLLPGTYDVSVAVTNFEDTEIFDYHDRLYPFRVYPGDMKEKYGLMTMRGSWHIENEHISDEDSVYVSPNGAPR